MLDRELAQACKTNDGDTILANTLHVFISRHNLFRRPCRHAVIFLAASNTGTFTIHPVKSTPL
jgi:hypothetical protein